MPPRKTRKAAAAAALSVKQLAITEQSRQRKGRKEEKAAREQQKKEETLDDSYLPSESEEEQTTGKRIRKEKKTIKKHKNDVKMVAPAGDAPLIMPTLPVPANIATHVPSCPSAAAASSAVNHRPTVIIPKTIQARRAYVAKQDRIMWAKSDEQFAKSMGHTAGMIRKFRQWIEFWSMDAARTPNRIFNDGLSDEPPRDIPLSSTFTKSSKSLPAHDDNSSGDVGSGFIEGPFPIPLEGEGPTSIITFATAQRILMHLKRNEKDLTKISKKGVSLDKPISAIVDIQEGRLVEALALAAWSFDYYDIRTSLPLHASALYRTERQQQLTQYWSQKQPPLEELYIGDILGKEEEFPRPYVPAGTLDVSPTVAETLVLPSPWQYCDIRKYTTRKSDLDLVTLMDDWRTWSKAVRTKPGVKRYAKSYTSYVPLFCVLLYMPIPSNNEGDGNAIPITSTQLNDFLTSFHDGFTQAAQSIVQHFDFLSKGNATNYWYGFRIRHVLHPGMQAKHNENPDRKHHEAKSGTSIRNGPFNVFSLLDRADHMERIARAEQAKKDKHAKRSVTSGAKRKGRGALNHQPKLKKARKVKSIDDEKDDEFSDHSTDHDDDDDEAHDDNEDEDAAAWKSMKQEKKKKKSGRIPPTKIEPTWPTAPALADHNAQFPMADGHMRISNHHNPAMLVNDDNLCLRLARERIMHYIAPVQEILVFMTPHADELVSSSHPLSSVNPATRQTVSWIEYRFMTPAGMDETFLKNSMITEQLPDGTYVVKCKMRPLQPEEKQQNSAMQAPAHDQIGLPASAVLAAVHKHHPDSGNPSDTLYQNWLMVVNSSLAIPVPHIAASYHSSLHRIVLRLPIKDIIADPVHQHHKEVAHYALAVSNTMLPPALFGGDILEPKASRSFSFGNRIDQPLSPFNDGGHHSHHAKSEPKIEHSDFLTAGSAFDDPIKCC